MTSVVMIIDYSIYSPDKATLIHREAKRRLAEVLAQPWIPPHCRHIVRNHSSCVSITKYSTAHTRGFSSKPFRGYEDPSKLSPGGLTHFIMCILIKIILNICTHCITIR